MSFTRKVKFPLTNHVNVTGIAHSNLFESEYSRVGLQGESLDSYTKLLLHCDGTDGSTIFNDGSGKTVTAYDNAQIDTAQSKFGGASALFDGNGDFLSLVDHNDWDMGTGDFTLEAWVRPATIPGAARIISQGNVTGNDGDWTLGYGTTWGGGTKISFAIMSGGGVSDYLSNAITLNINTWYHIAVARSSGTLYFFLDGVQVGTATVPQALTSAQPLFIGKRDPSMEWMNGWMDEIRISKGIARWTANFTPPVAEYTAPYQTNSPSPATVWTALQAGDVIDMSTAKAWMYRDGVVQVAGNTDITFKYAANNGSDSTAKTLTQLRAESDVTVTNETNSFKIYGLYASDSSYKSESETWIEFNVISAAGGGVIIIDEGVMS